MRVLITGIKGSGASYLAEYVANTMSEEVHGISRWHSTDSTNRNLRNVKNKVKMWGCDLTDFARVMTVLDEIKPTCIFNLASYSDVNSSYENPLSVLHNNVFSTANLLEATRLLKLNTRIVMCSTSEVYGIVDDPTPLNEERPIQPSNPYAVSKTTQDHLAYCYYKSYDMDIVRTRAFTYLNPRRHNIFATSFTRQVVEIELGLRDTLYHGNLNSTRTIIDVRDNMAAYYAVAVKGRKGEVYNIGGDTVMSVGDFLEMLKKLSRVPIKHEVDQSLIRPVDITLQIPDTSKIRKELKWAPAYDFEESMEFFLKEVRQDVCYENGINYESEYGELT